MVGEDASYNFSLLKFIYICFVVIVLEPVLRIIGNLIWWCLPLEIFPFWGVDAKSTNVSGTLIQVQGLGLPRPLGCPEQATSMWIGWLTSIWCLVWGWNFSVLFGIVLLVSFCECFSWVSKSSFEGYASVSWFFLSPSFLACSFLSGSLNPFKNNKTFFIQFFWLFSAGGFILLAQFSIFEWNSPNFILNHIFKINYKWKDIKIMSVTWGF